MKFSILVLLPHNAPRPAVYSQEVPLTNWNIPATRAANPAVHANGAISTGLLTFVAIAPCRIMDTRTANGTFGGPQLVGQQSRTVPIPSSPCGIPLAAAYSLNFTVVVPQGGGLGFLTAYPSDLSSPPNIATLNAGQGGIVGNSAVVPGGASDGAIKVFATNNTDLVIDANGYFIDQVDVTPSGNVALGRNALLVSTGNSDTALGTNSLIKNTSGNYNTAVGFDALASNTTGFGNTAVGYQTLKLANGHENIALGEGAGGFIYYGSYNIAIGDPGTSSDSGVIRLGSPGNQTSTYIAGISGVSVSGGQTVVVNSNGQLGVLNQVSSRRYKEDIQDMAESSDNLMHLRPVTFRYKQPAADGTKPLQYGLIAEEVQQLYPGAVDYNATGQVESVQYHKINAMLLNEVQKQRREIQALQDRLTHLESLLHH